MQSQTDPVGNFLEFWTGHLHDAELSHVYIVHCGGDHEILAKRIAARITLPYTLVDFVLEPEVTREIAIQHRGDTHVAACLVYLLDYGRIAADDYYRRLVKNLGYFDDWHISRVRLLADVPDFLFDDFFTLSRSDLQDIGGRLVSMIQPASVINVRNRKGELLQISVKDQPWYSMDGKPSDHILPTGELATIPKSVDGKISFEGTILGTIPFGFKYGRISKDELVLEFKKRILVGVSGSNSALVNDLQTILAALPALRRIGETAISFNTGITSLPGIGFQWEEKFPGFHFALGAELSENLESLSIRECDHHLDFIFADCSIYIDENPLFLNGKFLI